MHGRLLQRAERCRDLCADRRDDPLRRHARRRRRARAEGRRQALDGRRRRQDVDLGRADRRCLRRAAREDERPWARAHGRHARQARVDPRVQGRADDRRDGGPAPRRRGRDRRPDRASRPRRQEALRVARRDGDRGHRAADRLVDHVQEAGCRRGRDRARRQGRRRRVHEDARRRARARRGDARARPARRQGGHLPADRHGPAPRSRGRQRARDPRGTRHRPG